MSHPKFAALFIRLPIAMSFFGHGLVRLPKLQTFAAGMAEQFAGTPLPYAVVSAFGYVLVFVELITGIWLFTGRWFNEALMVGLTVMTTLIFGSALIENWNAVSVQLVHSIYLAGLLIWQTTNTMKSEKGAFR
ncbi:DoxX family protein [Parapedobacter sp. ISTM3]|uniref:Thiosulfate dehydrogenase [quinone] large subunit n=1 Tax=Parapedobacter luteus TaxID=623280 RepID=A0A1T5AXB1_9SPHI|nr:MULTISPECIES: DoxX family protein [Parapedobacter]MBK1440338.1 DoxX family protein [Parapedobacter sp. ISTM3]SKB39681.1 thiosulfate dehydrogenase [quinone] large subunit [Parapedobacter luteus]